MARDRSSPGTTAGPGAARGKWIHSAGPRGATAAEPAAHGGCFTEEIRLDQLSNGSQVCVLSDAGHIAVATYRGTSGAADPSTCISVDLKIWRNAQEPKDDQ
ncbi:hypothetical protein [Streptomyces sp. NPDC049813]|uniref:hypothetical protein n=1 Tax=Streptomyces sp. NPDC049813 TaxID=3365597 RepID=UPI0037B6E911